jgi:UDP-glucose 4-epimerase
VPASSAVTPARHDGEIGECHVPETHAIPLALDSAAGEHAAFTIFGTDYPTPDGTAVRDYVHVSDIADAHVLALHALLQGGECRSPEYRHRPRVVRAGYRQDCLSGYRP